MYSMKKHNNPTIQNKNALDARQRRANRSTRIISPGIREDQEVSPEVKLIMQRALEAVHSSPEVRAERVEALRMQIEAGTYQVDGLAIARKMLGIT